MKIDADFCANSYLRYRTLVDHDRCFGAHNPTWFYHNPDPRAAVNTADELDAQLRKQMDRALSQGPVALMLSGGMDSAILARYLPEGTQTYTLHCEASGAIDETQAARIYARENGLRHKVVHITWQDFEQYTLPLMRQKGYPIHSIEVQIYKAALQARADGIQTLIFGETADIIYGGHSKLLSREWTPEEFWQRFSFVDPNLVLRKPMELKEPILPYVCPDGTVDVFGFLNGFEYDVSLGFYHNACRLAGMALFAPYAHTILGHPLDIARIRSGEGKYVVRDLFCRLYPDLPIPEKTPLPRPMAQWLKEWKWPLHPKLRGEHIEELSGDQKWYVYALNEFLTHVWER